MYRQRCKRYFIVHCPTNKIGKMIAFESTCGLRLTIFEDLHTTIHIIDMESETANNNREFALFARDYDGNRWIFHAPSRERYNERS